jgi:hypothetical protein
MLEPERQTAALTGDSPCAAGVINADMICKN